MPVQLFKPTSVFRSSHFPSFREQVSLFYVKYVIIPPSSALIDVQSIFSHFTVVSLDRKVTLTP